MNRSASLKHCGRSCYISHSTSPSLRRKRPRNSCFTTGRVAYFAVFLAGCLSGSGLRTSGFTAVSSTGVVPVTSAPKFAPAGTR